jgi:integration host factor subunit beta
MNKSDIIDKIYELYPKLNKLECKKIVDALFISICKNISQGNRIEIRGFGSFSLKLRKAGFVRNPRAGTAIESGARNILYFRAGKELKQRVDKINL